MNQLKKDVASYAYDRLEEGVGQDQYIEDLHNEIFNTDYFIIGTYKAKQWLGDETFNAIEKIKDYEESNFGQVSTDISDPEKVANMLAYILGEEVLNDSMFYQTLTSYHTGVKLDEHRLNLIKDSLEV
tara:strand:+ start:303 stop:686 length:384 start_codon:yes stop_codon:yes gene_type:complete